MITYPRKCEHCEYISNNAAMYHYHKQTHNIIPTGTMCEHGCGNLANYIKTSGKFVCSEISQQCPSYKQEHSLRIKEQWNRLDSNIRKENTKKSLIDRLHTEENYKKISEAKRKKNGTLTPEDSKEYRHYARFIRQRAQKWAKDQGYIIGKTTYHVDHKLSILDAWNANLTEEIVNHPFNLQIVEAKTNTSKGSKSILSVEELLIKINALCELTELNDA